MFNVYRFEVNPLQENCYVVSDDSRECVIIDCGAYYDEESIAIDNYLRKQQLKPVHLLATHGHLDHNFGKDHNFGNAHLFKQYGLKVEVCAEDQQMVEHLPQQAASLFGMEISDNQPPVGTLLSDGDIISFVFSGDTLFRMSIGRTDFPEGSWQAMEQSLAKIAATLPKETVVYPGHGPQTTIIDELQYNPYLRR